jgi:integrase/recombinase XerD
MANIRWDRYPITAESTQARKWLTIQANLQLAPNTIDAYARGVDDFLSFSAHNGFQPDAATREHIALWVNDLCERPNPRVTNEVVMGKKAGLSNATIQQKITAVRLYFDHLIEEGARPNNPVGRGQHTPRKREGNKSRRGILPRYKKLPWIPDEEQWKALLGVINKETLRTKVMFALDYDCALRREELCLLEVGDFNFFHRTLHIRAETTKTKCGRVVPFSEHTKLLLEAYLSYRRKMAWGGSGRLFLSESQRNYAKPISFWTWSKVVRKIAELSGTDQLVTHTLRHLRLTDLARDGWDLNEIAEFAGHRSLETTRIYIHLSCRNLKEKLLRGMASIHAWREATLKGMVA